MSAKEIWALLGGIIAAIATAPYIIAILRKKARPTRVSWLIWSIIDTLVVAGMVSKHTMNWQMGVATLGAYTIFLLAVKYGEGNWKTIDKVCLVGALIGLVLWKMFDNATFGIIIGLVMLFLGAIPTFVSAWHDPSKEDRVAWLLFWLSCIATMLSISKWTIDIIAQPILFTVIESTMMFILWIKPRLVKP